MLAENLYRKFAAKTAAYQIVPLDIGTIFTNRGASGSVTFTLPPTADLTTGWWCRFFVVADQTIVVASSGSSDDLAAFNDGNADSVSYGTSAEKIGGGFELVWDGTDWLVFAFLGQDTQSVTVA